MLKMDYREYSRRDVIRTIRSVLSGEPGIVVIHSSLPMLKPKSADAALDIVASVDALVREGWTVALPAFTFSFCSGSAYVWNENPSETGALSDLTLRYFPDARRTHHPIYSHVIRGPSTDDLMKLQPETIFGSGSIFEWFEQENALVMMLGCGWRYCTQFHRYEELANVRYRYAKVFRGESDFGKGTQLTDATMWVRDLELDPRNDFSPAVQELRRYGQIAHTELWGGDVEVAEAKSIERVCKAQLKMDDLVYLDNASLVAKKLRDKYERESQPAITISVLGQTNLSIIERAWEEQLSKVLPERNIKLQSLPYGQLFQALLDKKGIFWDTPPDIRVFCDRLEEVPGTDWMDPDCTAQAVETYAGTLREYHEAVGGWSIIHRFSFFSPFTDSTQLKVAGETLAVANATLSRVFEQVPQIAWVDPGLEASRFDGEAIDFRLKYLGRFPWSKGFSIYLANRWTGLTLSMIGKDARLVVLDLDNTLWGGVVGEDGLAGIKVGGDYPGNVFKAFQHACLELNQRGVALAVSSKNDEDLALKALAELPEMVIRPNNLSAYRINWKPKWQNIQQICDELNLGLASVLFVDDNPVEREAVRRNLPDVKVLDLPEDPASYIDVLTDCVYLNAIEVNKEDLGRLGDFAIRKQRTEARAQAASMEDYFASLGTVIHINPLDKGNAQRAAQLCQKTNQFNTTTRRYEQRDLFRLVEEGADVVVLGLEDKLSPLENIGLMILKPSENKSAMVDLYLLSCRVLGRGIETVLPKWAAVRAEAKGLEVVIGEIIETERNSPARDIFKQSGYKPISNEQWKLPSGLMDLPDWLTLNDNME